MKWEKVKLGDLYTVHNGLSKGKKFFGTGFPFLSFSIVFNKWFIPEQLYDLVEVDEKERNSYSIKKGDVFITRTSETMEELGMSTVALKDYPNATYNGFTKRLRPITELLEPRFIGYYLRTPEFRGKFMAFSAMTTRASLTNDDLLSLEVPVPPFPVQQRIASILSAYDDLIENNQKQINLLEEAAQRLYKEWFVDLRFPGHEGVKVVDGVPEGWKKEKLIELAELKAGGDKPKIFSKIKSNICKVPIFSNGLENEGLFGYTDKADIGQESITISARGNVGYTCLRREPYLAIVRLICVIPRKMHISTYLYFYLKHTNYNSNGSAQQQLTIPMIKNTVVCVPDEKMLSDFDDKARCYFDLVDALKSKISSLREARDRLLPKLMSGEIEV